MASLSSNPIPFRFRNPKAAFRNSNSAYVVVSSNLASSSDDSSKSALRISADSTPKARFVARRTESISVRQLQRPLSEYMSLPASQYSVLDAERIERVDENTFRCYVYRFKFFAFEVCPVLLVRVEEQPNGCCIKLLSCKLEGSPVVAAQNDKFDASMENKISCDSTNTDSLVQKLSSDAVIEVSIEIPFAFRAIPAQAIESTGSQVLEQILKAMLPRFMTQLVKDYEAWASGDTSRQPLGTGNRLIQPSPQSPTPKPNPLRKKPKTTLLIQEPGPKRAPRAPAYRRIMSGKKHQNRTHQQEMPTVSVLLIILLYFLFFTVFVS